MWTLKYHPQSLKSLRKLDRSAQKRIFEFLSNLANCDDVKASGKALSAQFKGFWRYRVGDYRIICEVKQSELVVVVIDIGHRKEVYQKD